MLRGGGDGLLKGVADPIEEGMSVGWQSSRGRTGGRIMIEREWLGEFHRRMDAFRKAGKRNDVVISVKLRAEWGNFDHYSFPDLYPSLDAVLRNRTTDDIVVQEHENGPDWLVRLALIAGSMGVLKAVIELVTLALKSREKPRKYDDGQFAEVPPLILIVRLIDENDTFREKTVCKIEPDQKIKKLDLQAELEAAIEEIAGDRVKKMKKDDIIKRPAIDPKPKSGPKKKNTRVMDPKNWTS